MTHFTADSLRFGYGQRMIIDGVSLDLQAGEVLVLLGANGAGKTTLLRLLARHISLQSGSISLNDCNVSKWSSRKLAQQVALMPQHENRGSTLSVVDVVSLGRMPHSGWFSPLSKVDQERIDEAIDATGLQSLRDRSVNQLSGGEWRRMILARAIAQDTSVMMLDEPIAGLDLKYQHEVLDHVWQLTKRKQLITVLTLHDLNLAAMFADRVAVLHGGKVIALGTPDEVLRSDVIRQAFDVDVSVMRHPTLGTPLIIALGNLARMQAGATN